MPFAPTATTGDTSAGDKNAIPYSVWDVQNGSDPGTGGITAVVGIEDDTNQGLEFFKDMLGWSELRGTSLHRTLPEPCGYDRRAFCVKLDPVLKTPSFTAGVATNDSSGWPEYDLASYRATYVIPLYDVKEDGEVTYEHERFCVWRLRVVSQNEKIPGGGYKFADDDTPLNEVGVKTGRQVELTCKWLDVPRFDYDRLSGLCNKVNDAAVTWNGTTYTAETVLLTGVDAEPRVNSVGERTNDITFSFAVRTDGRTWNKFWKNGADGYVEVSSAGSAGGNKVFSTADLNTLWSFT